MAAVAHSAVAVPALFNFHRSRRVLERRQTAICARRSTLKSTTFGGIGYADPLRSGEEHDGRSRNQCGPKEHSIVDTLEPVLNQHRLVVCPSVIEADYNGLWERDGERAPYYRLFYQMTRPVEAKGALGWDDRIDALVGAVAFWTRHLSRDTNKLCLTIRRRSSPPSLEKFMRHALSNKHRLQRRWASSQVRNVHRRGYTERTSLSQAVQVAC